MSRSDHHTTSTAPSRVDARAGSFDRGLARLTPLFTALFLLVTLAFFLAGVAMLVKEFTSESSLLEVNHIAALWFIAPTALVILAFAWLSSKLSRAIRPVAMPAPPEDTK